MQDENILWSMIQNRIEARAKSLGNGIFTKQNFLIGCHSVFLQGDTEEEVFPSAIVITKDNKNRNILIKTSINQMEKTELKESND